MPEPMASIKNVDEASVEKKLVGAKNTQESIQSLSLWALHHKAQHDNIVRIWLNILKKSKIQRRLTLFYLCNEIVQTCKRKHAIMYKDAFKEVLRDAVLLVRDPSVRNNIERIFAIWEERNIYDSEFIEDLIAILNNTKIRPSAAKLLAEYKRFNAVLMKIEVSVEKVSYTFNIELDTKPSKLRESIGSFAKLEKEIDSKRRRLSSLNIDVTSQNYLKHLKDRSHGKQYTQQIEDIHRHLEDYVNSLDKQDKERQTLLELLEQSELFYDAQYGEAKIVTNAYKNFGTRVTNLRKKLDDVRKTLPDPLSPIPSPSMDAPSPVESVADVTEDNTEPIDMEMSDAEDDETEQKLYSPSNVAVSPPQEPASFSSASLDNPTPFADTHEEVLIQPLIGKSISLPSAPENVNSPSNSPVVTDAPVAIDYNSSFLSKLSSGALSSFSLQFNSMSSGSNVGLPSGIGTTASTNDDSQSADPEDDGGGTPVQDEKPDTAGSTVDPVALLNQLLNCTKKPASGGTDFLKSLSVLTQSMNVPFQPPKKDEKPDNHSPGNSAKAPVTLKPSKPDEELAPQFRPFYHSEDYLSVQPPSSQSGVNNSSPMTSLGHGIGTVESSSVVPVSDSSYTPVPPRGMEVEEKAPLPPPPLPPPFNYSPSGYPSDRQFESSTHPAYGQRLPYSGDPEFTAASSASRMEDNGNYQKTSSEGLLNIRPDLVEMLKNVLNTTKAAPVVGQGVPDVVGLRPFMPRPTLHIPDMPPSGIPDFRSADDNGEFVERLKKKTGFSSPVNDPLTSPKLFQQMLHTGPQRMRGFPPENEFHGPNRDVGNFQGLEPTYSSQSNDMPPMFDSYDSQVLPSRQFPIRPPGQQQPIEENHPIAPMVSGRIRSELAHPDIPPRGFGPPEFLNNNDRNSGNGPHDFDRHMGGNRFQEPFFNARPRFQSDFNPGNPSRPFMGGPPSRFPPMRPPPRFSQRGFYPPY